jgi:AraC family transcriptional regulator
MKRRIEVAKEQLRDERWSLAHVATECGFSDQSHLARVFKQAIGMSPGAWRRALRE